MAIRLHKLAVALGVFIVSAPAFSHGHHSHGKPLTEVEQKAANGVFDDANVQNRTLSDWDGVWQSVYPLLQSGKLDSVFQKKADADKTIHHRAGGRRSGCFCGEQLHRNQLR